MITREVTKLLRLQLHPLLREWGFEDFTGRTARLVDGSITITVQVKSVTKRFADVAGIPLGSIHADIGLDHGHANGAGLLRPESLGHDQMRLRAQLSRTAAMAAGGRPDIWLTADVGPPAAVGDVVESFRSQGRAFLDEWTDVERAYTNLTLAPTNEVEGAIGVPGLTFPGNPGSSSRSMALAVLAALRGDEPAERRHLGELNHPWASERIAELDSQAKQ